MTLVSTELRKLQTTWNLKFGTRVGNLELEPRFFIMEIGTWNMKLGKHNVEPEIGIIQKFVTLKL